MNNIKINHIKLLTRNYITTSPIINTYKKNKIKSLNSNIIKRKNDFMKDKLEDILSPQAKEYLKLEKEMKKDFALRRKLRHQRGDVNWSKNKTGFFWGLYTGVLFSGVAAGCYVFDK